MTKFLKFQNLSLICLLFTILITLNSCGIYRKTDAREIPTNANDRIKKNVKEGRGFKIGNVGNRSGSGDFQFASSNPLWRASLEKLDFAPLNNVDYAGGIIVTDWFSNEKSNEEIKITIRFLTNEIRSDALDIKVFKRKCTTQNNCIVTEQSGKLTTELTRKILKTAKIYEGQKKDKNFKPYKASPTN